MVFIHCLEDERVQLLMLAVSYQYDTVHLVRYINIMLGDETHQSKAPFTLDKKRSNIVFQISGR